MRVSLRLFVLALFVAVAMAILSAVSLGCLMHVKDLVEQPADAAACDGGTAIPIGTVTGNGVRALAVDRASVFVTTATSVFVIPNDGGAAASFGQGTDYRGAASDGAGGVYWVEHANAAPLAGTLNHLALDGSGVTVVLDQLTAPVAVAVADKDIVYLLEDGTVWALARTGASMPRQLAAPSIPTGQHGQALAVDGDAVFFAASTTGTCTSSSTVLRVGVDGGAPCSIATAKTEALSIAPATAMITWQSHCPDEIDVAPAACGETSLHPLNTTATSGPIASDGAVVFWGDETTATLLWKCASADPHTAPEKLGIPATMAAPIEAIAVDARFVYVATERQVFRVDKPCADCSAP